MAAKIDLEKLSASELEALIIRAGEVRKQVQAQERANLREEIMGIAAAKGYTIPELFGVGEVFNRANGKVKKSKTKIEPKYADPNDPSKTWSGRGKRPAWFHAALAHGVEANQMLIAKH
jgi:DNA-binding protein H-NS